MNKLCLGRAHVVILIIQLCVSLSGERLEDTLFIPRYDSIASEPL